jgi:hypothetical protein
VSRAKGKTGAEILLEDLALLRAAGVTCAGMDAVERLLAAGG